MSKLSMTRDEILRGLSKIKIIVANPTVTYDMGMQFDVLTANGALTTMGNVGQWPFMRFLVTDSFRKLKQRVVQGESISDDLMLEDQICKEICTYHDMWNGSFQLQGESLSKCIKCIKDKIKSIDLSGSELYAYVALEDWNMDIRFYGAYDDFLNAILADWEDRVESYESMIDSELEGWYQVAEENDWDGIPCASFQEDDSQL